jgi:hypothetical protein
LVSLGGALPFDWVLYDYVSPDQGKTWTSTKLGAGRDDTAYRIASMGALVGHRLVWSLAAVFLDSGPLTVNVTLTFRSALGEQPVQTVTDTWSVAAANPNAFVAADVA